jgi:hypothetical protein
VGLYPAWIHQYIESLAVSSLLNKCQQVVIMSNA